MICGAEHPDDPSVTCGLREDPTEHEFHYGYSKEHGNTDWPNPDYQPKVKLPTVGAPSPAAMAASVTKMVTAREATQEALVRVDAAADPQWKERAREALVQAARQLQFITADDLWSRGLDPPREARAIGPVFIWGKSHGYIEDSGDFTRGENPAHHQMPRRIWRSLVYEG